MMKELMTSLVNVQAAGIKAGLQAGDAERERLERERDALRAGLRVVADDLRRFREQTSGLIPEPQRLALQTFEDQARALLAKHGRLPT